MFKDRQDAGRQLAEKLMAYRGSGAIVLALPRGGVVVGAEIARALGLPLDIIVVRKIGHPGSPEYALAAVDNTGMILGNESAIADIDPAWFKEAVARERQEAIRRVKTYRGEKLAANITGKTIIIVDDGVATGLTLRLALMIVKRQKPKQIIVAVPVIAQDLVPEIMNAVDELVILEEPRRWRGAVGAHYEEFDQVTDQEVINLLK